MPRKRRVVKAEPGPAAFGFVELGSSGLRRSGGRVYDASLAELAGRTGMKNFREMSDLCSVVGASLLIFKLLLRDVAYRVEPGDGAAEGDAIAPKLEERAAYVDECLRDLDGTFDDLIAEACTQFTFGWAFLEETYKLRRGESPGMVQDANLGEVSLPRSKFDDGLVGWAGFALRAQETLEEWKWSESGRAVAFIQSDPYSRHPSVLIPLDKGLHFRTESVKANPEGKSLLVPAWLDYKLLKRIKETEAIGIARDLNGVPLMRIPEEVVDAKAGTPAAQGLALVKQILLGLTVDSGAGIYIPSTRDASGNALWDIELLATKGSRSYDTTKIIARYEHRIATTLLTAFMLLGQDQVGTQALAENNTGMLLACINGIASAIADTFTQQAFPRLMRVNGWPASEAPKLVAQKVRRAPSLKELTEYLNGLAGIGMTLLPDTELENDLRGRADLPAIKVSATGKPADPTPPTPEPTDPSAPPVPPPPAPGAKPPKAPARQDAQEY